MAVVLRLDPPRPVLPDCVAFRLRKSSSKFRSPAPFYLNRSSSRPRISCRREHRRPRSSITGELDGESDPNNPRDSAEEEKSAGVRAALSMLRFYKREISPILPNSCRYVPTCSQYSMEAYKKYGVVKGTVLTAWRLCRCNPLGGSGFDPLRWFDEERPSPEE